MTPPFVDIHCHLLPGIDDGAGSLEESVSMARMAIEDGIAAVIATPHQLGNYERNLGDDIRSRVRDFQHHLDAIDLPLRVLPGADVRIEGEMQQLIRGGQVLTLGDHGLHVLLELPHELYFPLHPVLAAFEQDAMVGILSHPERNQGVLRQPEVLRPLVEQGCLLQITAGSLCGAFGPRCQRLAERILCDGLVHFVATDAHGIRSRRPLMAPAFRRVQELVGEEVAVAVCCENPLRVANGDHVAAGRMRVPRYGRSWFGMRKVAG